MAAEWTYFLNKTPLIVGVGLSPKTISRQTIKSTGEFSVTLCSDAQAPLADFVGSFSSLEVDKVSTALCSLGQPQVISPPWVDGGLVALECVLDQVIELPVHHLYIATVVAAHELNIELPPLVKHGAMYKLGGRVTRGCVVAGVRQLTSRTLRVAATSPPDLEDPWRVDLIDSAGEQHHLGIFESNHNGDLLVECDLPDSSLRGWSVRVMRGAAEAGFAAPD